MRDLRRLGEAAGVADGLQLGPRLGELRRHAFGVAHEDVPRRRERDACRAAAAFDEPLAHDPLQSSDPPLTADCV